jgi:hypothetical protein
VDLKQGNTIQTFGSYYIQDKGMSPPLFFSALDESNREISKLGIRNSRFRASDEIEGVL